MDSIQHNTYRNEMDKASGALYQVSGNRSPEGNFLASEHDELGNKIAKAGDRISNNCGCHVSYSYDLLPIGSESDAKERLDHDSIRCPGGSGKDVRETTADGSCRNGNSTRRCRNNTH